MTTAIKTCQTEEPSKDTRKLHMRRYCYKIWWYQHMVETWNLKIFWHMNIEANHIIEHRQPDIIVVTRAHFLHISHCQEMLSYSR